MNQDALLAFELFEILGNLFDLFLVAVTGVHDHGTIADVLEFSFVLFIQIVNMVNSGKMGKYMLQEIFFADSPDLVAIDSFLPDDRDGIHLASKRNGIENIQNILMVIVFSHLFCRAQTF